MATAVGRQSRYRSGQELAIVIAIVLGLGFAAAMVANMGSKGILVAGGTTAIVVGLLAVRDRVLLILFLMVAGGLQFMLHKSFGPIDTTVSSGAEAVYVTSFDVFVALLYAVWLWQGTLFRDVEQALRQKVMWLPMLSIAAGTLSVIVATNPGDVLSELVRMFWMWALFVYVAVRVSTRREVTWIVLGLFAVALVQAAVVAYQYKAGGHLGLTILGEDTSTFTRTAGSTDTFRPAGTTLHPDILAAITGPIGLIALALAVNLRNLRLRFACLFFVAAAFAPLVLSQTRAAMVGTAAGAALIVALGLWTRRLTWSAILAPLPLVGIGVLVMWSRLSAFITDNFGTSHFQLEVDSRVQLNDVAMSIIHDHPILGVGLNNFMAVIDQYSQFGLIYPGYPVHNIFLLEFAEGGFLGVVAFVVTLVVVLALAIRVALLKDMFFSALGIGMIATLAFSLVEEQLSFSLREDAPLALFWLLAGLSLACLRMAGATKPAEPAEVADGA